MKRTVDMTRDELLDAARQMEVLGGSFAHNIARAFYAADSNNMLRLIIAFPELFERYYEMNDKPVEE